MLKVIVRRFETEAMGAAVVGSLESIGFQIAERISPDSDSMGGLIETKVMDDFELSADETEVIEICRQICPGCLVLWERYEVVEEGTSADCSGLAECEAETMER